MSADNGIYILRTPAPPIKKGNAYYNQHGVYEFRVAHCQAIDNIDWSDLYLPVYFGHSKVYDNYGDAYNEARRQEKDIADDGWFTEYGINQINKECHFPNLTPETARKALDCYVGAVPV